MHEFQLPESLVKLYEASKSKNKNIKLKDVQNYLKSKDAYTLHRVTQKKFARRKMLAPKPGVIISCDLADMRELSKYNNGVKQVTGFLAAVGIHSVL